MRSPSPLSPLPFHQRVTWNSLLTLMGSKKHGGNYGEMMSKWRDCLRLGWSGGLLKEAAFEVNLRTKWSLDFALYSTGPRGLGAPTLGIHLHDLWNGLQRQCEGRSHTWFPHGHVHSAPPKNYWVSWWWRIWSSFLASSDPSLALPPFPLRKLYAVPLSAQGPAYLVICPLPAATLTMDSNIYFFSIGPQKQIHSSRQ